MLSPSPTPSSSAVSRPATLAELPTPSFVIDRRAVVANCRRARAEAARNGIRRLRPHVKTHKTREGAWIQAFGTLPPTKETGTEVSSEELGDEYEEGVETEGLADVVGFVASTVPEIEMLVDAAETYRPHTDRRIAACPGRSDPFADVLYGVPISAAKLGRIDALRRRMRSLPGRWGHIHVLIDHPCQLELCEEYAESAQSKGDIGGGDAYYFTAYLKIDTGYHRAGVPPDERGLDLAAKLMTAKSVKLKGIYSHCGHAYHASSPSDLEGIARTDMRTMAEFLDGLVDRMEGMGWGDYARLRVPNLVVSVGSTPSLCHHRAADAQRGDGGIVDDGGTKPGPDSPGINLELHPGNYPLLDRQQVASGAAQSSAYIAGTVLATVIGHYPDRGTALLDAGSLALSKDRAPQGGTCAVAGWEDRLECCMTSQEATVVQMRRRRKGEGEGCGGGGCGSGDGDGKEEEAFPYQDFPLGSMVRLLPNHSCLAAACFDRFYIVDGDRDAVSIVDVWVPVRGW